MNHFDTQGNAVMTDVSDKAVTRREAVATGNISVSAEVIRAVKAGSMGKGDVLGVARIAGIMGAKRTAELIPLCHPLSITKCSMDFEIDETNCIIQAVCLVRTDGKTGVEMEALTGVSAALLTIYDMCKAVDKRMVIGNIHLVHKAGGRSGDFSFEV